MANTLTPTVNAANPGGIAKLAFNVDTPSTTDWVGLYLVAAGDTQYKSFVYAGSGNMSPPLSAVGSGACNYPVPQTLPPGVYNFRLFAADGFTKLATSPSVTVTAPVVSVSPTSGLPGDTVQVTFSGIVNPDPGDWIAPYLPAVTATQSAVPPFVYTSSGGKVPGTDGKQAGTVPFFLPTDNPLANGTYEFRIYSRDIFSLMGKSPANFNVNAQSPSVVVPTTLENVNIGTPIAATFSVPYGATVGDWVGLFPVDSPDDGSKMIAWAYTNTGTTQRGSAPKASGSVSIPVPTSAAVGVLCELRLLSNDGYTRLATSQPFAVTQTTSFRLFAANSPWNTRVEGYSVDANSSHYIDSLADVMNAVSHSDLPLERGGGANNMFINGAKKFYDQYLGTREMPAYSIPFFFVSSAVPYTKVAVAHRRAASSGDYWWSGFPAIVPMPNAAYHGSTYALADPGYGALHGNDNYGGFPDFPTIPPNTDWDQFDTGDHSLVIVDTTNNLLWEFWNMGLNIKDVKTGLVVPGWSAEAGICWPLYGPGYGTLPVVAGNPPVSVPVQIGARAYSGPASGGLILKRDMDAGVIRHALAFAYSWTHGRKYAAGQATGGPMCIATHADGYCPTQNPKNNSPESGVGVGWSIPEGSRLRLKSTVDVEARAISWQTVRGGDPNRRRAVHIIGLALQRYGMYVLDHAGVLYDTRTGHEGSLTQIPTATLYAEHPYSIPGNTWGSGLWSDDVRAFNATDFELLKLPALSTVTSPVCP